MRPEKTGPGMKKDSFAGSPALTIRAERVMIEAAEQAVREKRDPARMLRVLALLASPVHDPLNPDTSPVHLDLQAEWHRLAEGVRQSGAPILLARLGPPTLPALRAALSPRAAEQSVFPHLLHFSGHAWEEGMVLEDDLGQMHLAGTAQVLAALKGIPHPLDLVVLNGCESAASARSVAQALLEGGLARAVVGHERSVLDSEAVAFAARLYAELCGGFPLQDALENARREITTHEVILLGEENLSFEGLSGGEPWIDERRQKGSLLPHARLFLGRGRELVRMSATLAKPPAVIIISGPPGMGKSSLLLEAALRCGWRFPGGVAYAAGPRAEEARAASAEGLLASLAGELGLERAEDLFPYTSMQPTLLLLDNLDSLADLEKVKLGEALRRLGPESAAILALRPSSLILEELPSAIPIHLHHGLAIEQAAEYALTQSTHRGIPLTMEKAYLIASAVSGHPLLVERLVAQAGRQDLDELLEDVAKKSGDYASQIERVYSWCAIGLDPDGEAAWRALTLFPGGSAPEVVLKAAGGEEGPEKLLEAALADFDSSGQLWRWHATAAEYARSHWPLPEEERRAQRLALLPAWERWLRRLPAGELSAHSRLEGSRSNLEAAVGDCAGDSREEAMAFLDELDGKLPRPDRTLKLRELVTKTWKAKLQSLPAKEKTERAKLLNDLGVSLSALGRREDALAAAKEAAEIYRTLTQSNQQTLLPDLARSLNNLGLILSELGRREDALATTKEAAEIYRTLVQSNPQAFLPDLARSLNNLGLILSGLGRRGDALAAAEESANIYRNLARSNPQAFLPDLARSLNTLSTCLSELGRWKDALTAAEEAANIYRNLAMSNPQAFLPDLAMSLNNLGNRLSDLGWWEDSFAAAKKAADIRRTLAQSSPQTFLPDLAISLNNQGAMLYYLGQRENALSAAEEAVDINRTLVKSNPQAFLSDLAMSLNNLGTMLSGLGQWNDALALAEETTGIYRNLARSNLQAFQPKLAMSLNNLGNRLFALGRLEDALAAAEEAVGIYRNLDRSNPHAFLPSLAAGLNNLGAMRYHLGRREDAMAAAKEAEDIYRTLAQSNPQTFLPGLARNLGVYGNVLLSLERYGEAARAFSEGLSLLAPFFKKHPQAFSDLASALKQLYLQACQKAGREPDRDLLSGFD